MRTTRAGRAVLAIALLVAGPWAGRAADPDMAHDAVAKRYFRGVYGCDSAVVDDLASDDIVVSYPVFETLFGKPALRGREAVRAFAVRFCGKWGDPHIEFHEAVSEGDRVVLLWSFRARDTGSTPPGQEHRWGGLTLFRFDQAGKVEAEVGEESEPGPMGRLGGQGAE
jgi:ketosteroid isomerase-like protein